MHGWSHNYSTVLLGEGLAQGYPWYSLAGNIAVQICSPGYQTSNFQPLCMRILVLGELSTGAPQEFQGIPGAATASPESDLESKSLASLTQLTHKSEYCVSPRSIFRVVLTWAPNHSRNEESFRITHKIFQGNAEVMEGEKVSKQAQSTKESRDSSLIRVVDLFRVTAMSLDLWLKSNASQQNAGIWTTQDRVRILWESHLSVGSLGSVSTHKTPKGSEVCLINFMMGCLDHFRL